MIPYVVVLLVIVAAFIYPAWLLFRQEEAEARELLEKAKASGKHEPVSIRPWIDPELCMGSGTCVAVCPELTVLQVMDGRARLVSGSKCVGHGACEAACPVGAIELRFGSERRGVDIPAVKPDFQTNVDGLYVTGELGGMGLIANAIEQGSQAIDNLRKAGLPATPEGGVDLLIIGAGPAGIAAGLKAEQRGLNYLVIEQGELGGSIRHYPRQKLVMSRGFTLPGRAPVTAGLLSKEELIALLESAVRESGMKLAEREQVLSSVPEGGGFLVKTPKREIRASKVILAVGRRGTPRKLGVPGEDHAKVAYRLLDPELYAHQHVLVVGGGDSAVEAACALADQPGVRVSLSYRGEHINRPRERNQELLKTMADAGRIDMRLGTKVREIGADRVVLTGAGDDAVLPNDQVFVFAGGVLPTQLLVDAGIRMERHFGMRVEQLGADGRPA